MYYPPTYVYWASFTYNSASYTCIGHLSRVIRHLTRVFCHHPFKIAYNGSATGLRAVAMRLCIGRFGDMKQCRRFILGLFDINIQFFRQKI